MERFNKLHHVILGWLLLPRLFPLHQALDGGSFGGDEGGRQESVVRY